MAIPASALLTSGIQLLTPDPILNHKDTKNTKQTEPTSVLTLFVSLCLRGEFLCRIQGLTFDLTRAPADV